MKIRFLSNTNIRRSPRDFSILPLGVIFAGTELEVDDRLYRGKELEGINTYFRDERGWYFWSGRVAIIYKAIPPPTFDPVPSAEPQERIGGDWEIQVEDPDILPTPLSEHTLITSESKQSSASVRPLSQPVFQDPDAFLQKNKEHSEIKVTPSNLAEFQYQAQLLHWGLEKHQIPYWWKEEKLLGKGIKVAILGTGIDIHHPDLSTSVRQAASFCSHDQQDISDQAGLGTYCAGLVCGQGKHQFLGAAPGAGLWVAKVMEHELDLQMERIWAAFDWIFQYPVDLILFTFDLRTDALSREQRIRFKSYIEKAVSKEIMVLAPIGESHGNRTEDRLPAGFPLTLSIGGHDQKGLRLKDGVRSYNLDLLAPGTDLFSGREWQRTGGSSAFAASFTTGVLALAMEFARKNHIRNSAKDWMRILKETAIAKFQLTKCKDIEYGCGVFDPPALLNVLRSEFGEHAEDLP